jgi:hypothetical protein
MRIRYMLATGVGTAAVLSWLCVFLAASFRGRRITGCPSCLSDRVRPSWPTFIDKILSYSEIRAYRCDACRKRFYALKPRVAS